MNNITGNKRRYLPGIGDGRDGGGWHGGGNFQTNTNYRHQPRSHYQVRQQQSQYVQRQHPTQQQYNQKQQWLRRNPNVSGFSTANTVDSSSQDCKAQLNMPAADSRFKTEDAKGSEFEDYFIKREILMGIYDKGFVSPSPIQEEIIPIALSGSDVLARAKNGTGKTSTFCIPALEKINTDKKGIQVVIMVPTSELALETAEVCKELGQHLKVEVMVTSGGTSLDDDCRRLCHPVHLLIGTPGRILELTKIRFCDLDACAMLVLDEADKLLCPEFQPSVEDLISNFLPESRQILMFSATFPDTVEDFKQRHLKNPYLVNSMDELTLLFQAAEVGWLEKESLTLNNKVRCIERVAPRFRTEAEMCAELAEQKLTPMPKVEIVADVANASTTRIIPGTEYDYLLSMPVRNWIGGNLPQLREKRDKVTSLLLTETDAYEKQLLEEQQEMAEPMET